MPKTWFACKSVIQKFYRGKQGKIQTKGPANDAGSGLVRRGNFDSLRQML
jgi:hypothetical protein